MTSQSTLPIRVNAIYAALKEVLPKTEQEFLEELCNNSNPEKVLTEWEIVAFAYTAFFEARTPTAKAKDQALRVLLDCLAGFSEKQIHKEAYKSLSIAEIRSLIAHYMSAEQTVLKIAQFKKNR